MVTLEADSQKMYLDNRIILQIWVLQGYPDKNFFEPVPPPHPRGTVPRLRPLASQTLEFLVSEILMKICNSPNGYAEYDQTFLWA